jgi:tetratricopeptide (TPR) repeat protein
MKTFLVMAVLFVSATAHGQAALKLPEASPAASVAQTIGLTDVTVVYHRPAVAGRAVWGKLVPYGETWRAGANENTTITFSSDVKVGGKPLKAGTYGLHMLPTAKDWTVMFSTMSLAWGSFSYDQKEDALRITVTPKPTTTSEERLSYRFDDPSETKATLVLAWEKLEVPIAIEAETPKIAMASVRQQLRGPAGFTWQGFAQAAAYALQTGATDEALKLVDRSIAISPSYRNLTLRASIVEKQGNAKAAAELRARAQGMATEGELNQAGYRLISEKKLDEAIKLFQTTAERFPESWNAQDSLGEALASKGDKAGAIAAYTKASALAKDPVQKKRIDATIVRLKAP